MSEWDDGINVGTGSRQVLRVARLVNRLPPARGGKEIHVAELSRALADLGIQQHVFARVGSAIDPKVSLSRLGHRFSSDSRRTLVAYSGWSTAAIWIAHRRRPFDLIHVHGDFVEAAAGAAAAQLCRVPAVLTVHGGLGSSTRHSALRRATFSRMRHIWAVSHDLAHSIRQLGVTVPIAVRSSGVRQEFFADGPNERCGGVIAVGRLSPVKGLETLLEAYDLLAGELTVSWTLLAGGEGPYADRIRTEIARRPGMRCLEENDPVSLARRVRHASVFVLPSIPSATLNEGVPTALLEAIAAGAPVVASDTGGVPGMLDDGRAGVVVPPGDSRALADAIAAVVEDPTGARQRAERASSLGWAVRWDSVARDVAQRYAEIVAGAPE